MALQRKIATIVKRIPVISSILRSIYSKIRSTVQFESSGDYWEERYASSGDSGDGSYGRLAKFKAEVINSFVGENSINTVIEFGCGDGAQLKLMEYPSYVGVDVSNTIIDKCSRKFEDDAGKKFVTLDGYAHKDKQYDLSLSLDVIYHLIEDEVYEAYMHNLFGSSKKWVIVYSSDTVKQAPYVHVKHRKFTEWVKKNKEDWEFSHKVDQRYPISEGENGQTSFADFFFFRRKD